MELWKFDWRMWRGGGTHRAAAEVAGEHLQRGAVAGDGVRVGQQELEPIAAAPGGPGVRGQVGQVYKVSVRCVL